MSDETLRGESEEGGAEERYNFMNSHVLDYKISFFLKVSSLLLTSFVNFLGI